MREQGVWGLLQSRFSTQFTLSLHSPESRAQVPCGLGYVFSLLLWQMQKERKLLEGHDFCPISSETVAL